MPLRLSLVLPLLLFLGDVARAQTSERAAPDLPGSLTISTVCTASD